MQLSLKRALRTSRRLCAVSAAVLFFTLTAGLTAQASGPSADHQRVDVAKATQTMTTQAAGYKCRTVTHSVVYKTTLGLKALHLDGQSEVVLQRKQDPPRFPLLVPVREQWVQRPAIPLGRSPVLGRLAAQDRHRGGRGTRSELHPQGGLHRQLLPLRLHDAEGVGRPQLVDSQVA